MESDILMGSFSPGEEKLSKPPRKKDSKVKTIQNFMSRFDTRVFPVS